MWSSTHSTWFICYRTTVIMRVLRMQLFWQHSFSLRHKFLQTIKFLYLLPNFWPRLQFSSSHLILLRTLNPFLTCSWPVTNSWIAILPPSWYYMDLSRTQNNDTEGCWEGNPVLPHLQCQTPTEDRGDNSLISFSPPRRRHLPVMRKESWFY